MLEPQQSYDITLFYRAITVKVIVRGKVVVSVNEIEKRVVNVGGKIEVRPMVNLNFTVDHRFVDGGRAKKIYEIVIFTKTGVSLKCLNF